MDILAFCKEPKTKKCKYLWENISLLGPKQFWNSYNDNTFVMASKKNKLYHFLELTGCKDSINTSVDFILIRSTSVEEKTYYSCATMSVLYWTLTKICVYYIWVKAYSISNSTTAAQTQKGNLFWIKCFPNSALQHLEQPHQSCAMIQLQLGARPPCMCPTLGDQSYPTACLTTCLFQQSDMALCCQSGQC